MEILRDYDGCAVIGKRDIDGYTLRRLYLKSLERQAKKSLLENQQPEPKGPSALERCVKAGFFLVLGLFGVMIVIQVVKAVIG